MSILRHAVDVFPGIARRAQIHESKPALPVKKIKRMTRDD
jgi:hypothetical protein